MVDVRSKKSVCEIKTATFCHIHFNVKKTSFSLGKGTLDGVGAQLHLHQPYQLQLLEVQNAPPLSVIVFKEMGVNDELYDQLEQAMSETDTSERDAFEESIRLKKAEKDAMDAKQGIIYANEMKEQRLSKLTSNLQ
nr:U-box domain-containing protein kinase family protein [Tanacetum cinerariifolium]